MHEEVAEERSGGVAAIIGPPSGFGRDLNGYLNHYVTVADAKAGAVVAGALALLALYLSASTSKHWLPIALAGAALVVGTAALFPRLPKGRQGVLFWEDIRNHGSEEAYVDAVRRMGAADVEAAYARQNYHAATVVHAKMQVTRWALAAFVVGALATAYFAWRG